jgi:hypothetical protein
MATAGRSTAVSAVGDAVIAGGLRHRRRDHDGNAEVFVAGQCVEVAVVVMLVGDDDRVEGPVAVSGSCGRCG